MRTKAILSGHSRGLGAALATELLQRQIPLLGISRRPQPQLARLHPPSLCQQVSLDLAAPAALQGWLAGSALTDFAADADRLLLINNAGLLAPVGPPQAQAVDAVLASVNCNVGAALALTAAAARAHAGELRVLHVASGAGRRAISGWSVYGAGKAALDHHARCLAGTPNLRIASLAPGVIDTDMQAEIRQLPLDDFPDRASFIALHEQRQLAAPADCAARIVAYLLADDFGAAPLTDLRTL